MYITKTFDTFSYLVDFLNTHHIPQERIVSINVYSFGVALVYFDPSIPLWKES